MARFTRKEVHDEVIDIINTYKNGAGDIDESYVISDFLADTDIVREAEQRFDTFFVEGFEKVNTVGDFINAVVDVLKTEGRLEI